MSTTIKLKKSGATGNIPSNSSLEFGELALNYADGILYYKNATNTISQISGSAANTFETINANGTLIIADSNTDILSLLAGDAVYITGNGITDSITIGVRSNDSFFSTATNTLATANIANALYSIATSAYAQANSNYQPAVTRLNVTNSGASAYLFDQYSGNNPTLYVRAGESIAFSLNVSGHPFMIRTSSGGSNYNTGLTHVAANGLVTTGSSAQGKEAGTLYWKIPYDLQGNTYVYQCSIHGGMVGNIVIEPPSVIAYGQANAAYGQANAAYVQANAAYAKANAPITIKEVYASNANVINTFNNINTIQFDADSGMAVVDESNNTVTIQLNSTFKNWYVDGSPGLVASGLDTVNFIAGNNITITANNSNTPKSIIFEATGGGGGAGSSVVESDVFSANGVQSVFTLTRTTSTDKAFVYISGVAQIPQVDYQVAGKNLTFNTAPLNGTTVEVRSIIDVQLINTSSFISDTFTANGAQTVYQLSGTPYSSNGVFVFVDGVTQVPAIDYTVSGDFLTFTAPPEANGIVEVRSVIAVQGATSESTPTTYDTSNTATETIDQWSKSLYRSAKYQIQVESSTGYLATEIMVIHDGVDTNTILFGTASFGSNVGVFTSDISGSNVRLRFTATDPTSNLTFYRTTLTNRASESLPTDLMTGNDSYDLMITLPFNPTDLN